MYYNYLSVDYSSPCDPFLKQEIRTLFDEKNIFFVSRYKIIGLLAHDFEEAGQTTPLTRVCLAIFKNRYLSSGSKVVPTDLQHIDPEIQKILEIEKHFFS